MNDQYSRDCAHISYTLSRSVNMKNLISVKENKTNKIIGLFLIEHSPKIIQYVVNHGEYTFDHYSDNMNISLFEYVYKNNLKYTQIDLNQKQFQEIIHKYTKLKLST